MAEKSYKFKVSTGFGKSHEYFVKEEELDLAQKEILMGQLISAWENNTQHNRIRFAKMILESPLFQLNNELQKMAGQ